MPLYNMAAEAGAHRHGALEIDQAAGFEIAQAGDAQGLHKQVKRGGLSHGILGRDGKTAAVHGHTFTIGQLCGHGADLQGQAGTFAAGFETEDGASGFDEAGKHEVV
ncbi:hypothetical protein BGE01nite_31100 [Brevifollis gellanilyticus]|uniref:Uncharacterized protein n=1 Tax=Brevifollis gellanilyticus TaxID=748831 RepID=A0A512MAR5_9BACT|nr:hypothetical protein BGE01nite_31100 [Brevifollis gellanilyticus]